MELSKIERITNIVLSADCRSDAHKALQEYFIEEKTNLFVDLKAEKQELLDACKSLWKEADDLRKHTADNFFIDWEDQSIEGTRGFTKALDNAYKTINKYR